jgi:perosamine synthetase
MVGAGSPKPVYAVAVANGTLALQAALMGLGIGPGDEVLVPAFTFIATANAVRAVGATPVFVDVRSDTGNIDVDSAAARASPRCAAIIPVHLYGMPADIHPVMALADRLGIAVVEDAAQAHGAMVEGRSVGSFGTGCFSLYPTKNMTSGEGGVVTTSDLDLADRLRRLRNHGMVGHYQFEDYGLNFRMTDIAAALARVQLRRLPGWNAARQRNAAWLDAHLSGVELPVRVPGFTSVYHQYTLRSDARAQLIERLESRGVGYGIYYPQPLHRTAPYHSEVSLPNSERLSREVLSIPVRPDLSHDDLITIAEAVEL